MLVYIADLLDGTSRTTSYGTIYRRFDFRGILREWCNETQKELDFVHEVGTASFRHRLRFHRALISNIELPLGAEYGGSPGEYAG